MRAVLAAIADPESDDHFVIHTVGAALPELLIRYDGTIFFSMVENGVAPPIWCMTAPAALEYDAGVSFH